MKHIIYSLTLTILLILGCIYLNSHYDFMDVEGEGDSYADYQVARDRIDSLTIK